MKIYSNFEQGSEEWIKCRMGHFTASTAQAIANKGKGLDTLVFEKVAEILTGKMKPSYTNEDIERGHELENIARGMYEVETGRSVKQVGFVEHDSFSGCSPDGFVDDDGLIEIKCKDGANFVKYLYTKEIETGHQWQMQMQLWITKRKWCDYVVFNENFTKSISITRVYHDEVKISQIIAGVDMAIAQTKAITGKIT